MADAELLLEDELEVDSQPVMRPSEKTAKMSDRYLIIIVNRFGLCGNK
jgi:hypothetical protein